MNFKRMQIFSEKDSRIILWIRSVGKEMSVGINWASFIYEDWINSKTGNRRDLPKEMVVESILVSG